MLASVMLSYLMFKYGFKFLSKRNYLLGIEEGQWIVIETPVGSVRQQAKTSDRLAHGVVHADRWWYPEGTGDADDPYGVRKTNINMCTSNAPGDADPVMGTWLMRGLPCRLSTGG